MATSTVPAIAGGPNYTEMSLSWIDNEEREYTWAIRINGGATDVQKQAVLDAAQAASNASSWKVQLRDIFEGAKNAANADANAHESVQDKIRLSYKQLATGAYEQAYIPAPLTVIIGDGGIVDTDNALYTAFKTAVDTVILTGFLPLNTEFVEYAGRNDVVSP